MHRRDFLKTLAAGTISYGILGCANGLTQSRTAKRKPNFVFFSDNGGYANATAMPDLRGSKGQLYEGGIRVPCIVRKPKISPRNCDIPIIGIDFYPTILEMAGVAKPVGCTLDGESLVGLIQGQEGLKRDAIFWHFPAYLEPYNDSQWPWRITPSGAIRQGPWKLIECFEDGHVELYNLDDDLHEKHDLSLISSG